MRRRATDGAPSTSAPRRGRAWGWAPRGTATTALILLVFIIVPGGVLGYLSWRALREEQAFALERLRASYGQLADLASRQMDFELRSLEARWNSEFEALVTVARGRPTSEQVAARAGREPLIAGLYLMSAPGRLLYPELPPGDVSVPAEGAPASEAGEHELFTRLTGRGEALEYESGDLAGAAQVYRDILARVGNPRLRALTQSYLGRVQLKSGDREGALATYGRLLARYPEVRDQNRMYLRFLAQYQMAVALEGLRRYEEALETLLALNQDLLARSESITASQYTYYADLVRILSRRLLASADPSEAGPYAAAFRALGENTKSRITGRYFVDLLDAELSEITFQRKRFLPRTRYLSARAEGDPFLLAYRTLPDDQRIFATGILAAEIDLDQVQSRLLRAVQDLRSDSAATVAVVGQAGVPVIGAIPEHATLMGVQHLAPPFDFWQVAVYLQDVPGAMKSLDLRRTLWLWLVTLMVLSILGGGYAFIRRVRRDAYVARAQTNFISNVTHELRAPLASIRMFAELIELQMADARGRASPHFERDAAEHLGIIRRECDRLTRLISGVIDFSRMERRIKTYRLGFHDVGAVVTSAVESFRPNADARGFRLDLSVAPSLPPLRIDPDAIAQVILNLLTNAVRYSDDEKAIRVRVGREATRIVIEVADRGIGIAREDLDRVFDRFYSTWRRMDSTAQGGLGLGLTLSREIVEAHGGEIGVRSSPGQGSTFTVSLPAPVTAREPVAGPADEPEVRPIERFGGQRG